MEAHRLSLSLAALVLLLAAASVLWSRFAREPAYGGKTARSFKDFLLAMPNMGQDKGFERGPHIERPVKL